MRDATRGSVAAASRAKLGAMLAAGTAMSAALVASCAAVVDLEPIPYAPLASDASMGATSDAGDEASSQNALDAGGPEPNAKPDAAADAGACAVRSDTKLYCTNRVNAPLRAEPRAASMVVNTLRSASSYFLCWGTGEPHAGGNSTWYYTIGDDNPNLGWLPGVMLNTPDAFDANPTAFGLRNCSQ